MEIEAPVAVLAPTAAETTAAETTAAPPTTAAAPKEDLLVAWRAFLKSCHLPRDKRLKTRDISWLTGTMFEALAAGLSSPTRSADLLRLLPAERRWVHERALAVGVQTTSVGSGTRKDVRLSVKEGWDFAARMAAGPPDDLESACWANQQAAKGYHPYDPLAQPEPKRERDPMVSCENCGEDIFRSHALYNVFVRGPYCERCTEEDEELSPHKWEYC
ncbi:Hypothetical protein UVM_LOCUS80 [uncultured virus]|nr:Hypothetical protein UVM_LOCUS80 [uncultured virus]